MIVNFPRCFSWLLAHEGGFSNHARDPGNATMLGVTKATYEDYVGRSVSIDEIKNLTQDDVEPIYKKRYWDRVHGDVMPSGLDWMLFDWGVNSGPRRASKALQLSVGVRADGVIGPNTMDAVSKADIAATIEAIHRVRELFYRRLSTFDTFGRGWIRRNDETLEQSLNLFHR